MARLYAGVICGALLATLTGAGAADLPRKAAGVNYVKQCTAEGAGFYYVPGTDTCLRVGGYVYAEGYYNTYTDYPATNNKTYSVPIRLTHTPTRCS